MRRTLTLMMLLMATPAAATAQTRVEDTGFRKNIVKDDTLLKQGRLEVALQSAGMWTKDSGESSDGSVSASAGTFYANPAVAAGYMALDALQVRLNLGYLKLSTTNNDVTLQDFNGFLGTLGAYYHVPFQLGTALYLGAGGGYMVGSTTRPSAIDDATFSNATSGFAGQGTLGLLVQPGPALTLRGGIRFDALIGSEKSAEPETMPDFNTTNLKLVGEFAVGLRF